MLLCFTGSRTTILSPILTQQEYGEMKKVANVFARMIQSASTVSHRVGIGILLAMMFLTAADVFGRYFLHRPIVGAYELQEYLMVCVVSLTLAYGAVEKGHVVVDILVSRFPRRAQAIIGAFTTFFGVCLCSVITWQAVGYVQRTLGSGLVSATLKIPRYPFIGVLVFGMALFCLVLVKDFLEFLSQAVRK